MTEAVGTEHEDVRQLGRIFRVGAEMIIHDQVAARAVVFHFGFPALGMRQQIAEGVGPQLVEALPGHPIGRPAALGIRGKDNCAAQSVLPADQQRIHFDRL